MEERTRRREELRLQVWLRYGLFAFALFLLGSFIYLTRSALTPIAIGWIIAYALNPLIDRMERWGVSRTRSIFFLLLTCLILVTLFLLLFVPYFISEMASLGENLSAQSGELFVWFEGWLYTTFEIKIPATISETISQYKQQIADIAPEIPGMIGPYLGGVLSGVGVFVGFLLNFLLIPLFIFYFLRDFHKIAKGFLALVPDAYRPKTQKLLTEIDESLGGFLHGQVIVALIQGVLFAIGLLLLGVKFGFVIGILSGIGCLVPYLGIALGIIFSLIMSLLVFQSWIIPVAILALFFFVNLFEGFFLTPRLVGGKVGLSPVAVIIALLLFGELFGIVGLVIAVPLAAVLRIFWKALATWIREHSSFFSRSLPEEVTTSEISQVEKSILRVSCQCGGEFIQSDRTDLLPPVMGAILSLSCTHCGNNRRVRFDIQEESKNTQNLFETISGNVGDNIEDNQNISRESQESILHEKGVSQNISKEMTKVDSLSTSLAKAPSEAKDTAVPSQKTVPEEIPQPQIENLQENHEERPPTAKKTISTVSAEKVVQTEEKTAKNTDKTLPEKSSVSKNTPSEVSEKKKSS